MKVLNNSDLLALLKSLNFKEIRQHGTHLILRNDEFNSVITFPQKSKKEVPKFLIAAIKRNLIENGIITQEQFNDYLEQKSK